MHLFTWFWIYVLFLNKNGQEKENPHGLAERLFTLLPKFLWTVDFYLFIYF